jgi:hypothetical protein
MFYFYLFININVLLKAMRNCWRRKTMETDTTRSDIGRTLLFAGLGSALVAGLLMRLATVTILQYDVLGNILCVSTAIGSGLVAPLFWWLFIVQPRQLTILRGTLAGMATSVVAYPVIWCMIAVLAFFFIRQPEYGINLGETVQGGIYGNLVSALFLAYWSFVSGIWIPLLAIGALVGQGLVIIQGKVREQLNLIP